jgi:hypothetical protein
MMAVISVASNVRRIAMKFRTSFIQSEGAFAQKRSINQGNCGLSVRNPCHLHEGEPTSVACVPIFDDSDGLNRSV